MVPLKLCTFAVLSLAFLGLTLAQQLSNDERCQVIEGNGVRVDQCDGTKLLACKDGRCQCGDPVNQIFTYRNEPISSRGKRSPGKKGGGFKKFAVGAAAGAATYHVASQAGKAVSNGFTTTPPPPKYRKVYSCYSRAGGQCALNYNNWQSVDATTSTTAAPAVTSEASAGNETTTASDNSTTTTTAAPVAAAQTKLDITKIPQCVQHAVCKPSSPSTNSTSGFLQKVDFDPRIGVCECESGYERTSKDVCVKKNGAEKTVGISMAVILASLIVNKMFV